jgi:sugar-phosphatase
MFQAVIFDMDGLLVNSEPIWQEVEIKIFGDLGVPVNRKNILKTTGLRTDEVVHYWHSRSPWKTPSQRDVTEQIISAMVDELSRRDSLMPGVHHALELVRGTDVPMAIASSSVRRIINAALRANGIADEFGIIHSAEHEPFGKPHPGVYISAAEKLEVKPQFCLAFEDSPNGVLAAKAAKMACVAVPEPHHRDNAVINIADIVLDSLEDLTPEMLRELHAKHTA